MTFTWKQNFFIAQKEKVIPTTRAQKTAVTRALTPPIYKSSETVNVEACIYVCKKPLRLKLEVESTDSTSVLKYESTGSEMYYLSELFRNTPERYFSIESHSQDVT